MTKFVEVNTTTGNERKIHTDGRYNYSVRTFKEFKSGYKCGKPFWPTWAGGRMIVIRWKVGSDRGQLRKVTKSEKKTKIILEKNNNAGWFRAW